MSLRPRMRVTGVSNVRAELRRIEGAVLSSSRDAMREGAAEIVKTAKSYAPADEGNLENAIGIIQDYSGGNGRLQIDVGITARADALNPTMTTLAGSTGTPISFSQLMRYAAIMHENWESYKPGPRSLVKISQGHNVGSGFITRAAKDNEEKLRARLVSSVTEVIEGVQGDFRRTRK